MNNNIYFRAWDSAIPCARNLNTRCRHTSITMMGAGTLGLDPCTAACNCICRPPCPPGDGITITYPCINEIVPSLTYISGKAIPGAIVTVYIDGDLELQPNVDADGLWKIPVDVTLSVGTHYIIMFVQSPDGFIFETSYSFIVSGLKVDIPAITYPANGAIINTNAPTFSGTGIAGDTVHLCVVGIECKGVTVAADGTWSTTFNTALTDRSTYTVTAYQTDTNGDRSSTVRNIFTVNVNPVG